MRKDDRSTAQSHGGGRVSASSIASQIQVSNEAVVHHATLGSSLSEEHTPATYKTRKLATGDVK